MLHFVENKSCFKDLNRESTPYVSCDSDVQYEDIMQVTATYCLSEPTLNIIDFIQFIRPGGLQPCAAEHRGRDERSEVRGPCALLRTAEARRVFQRKTEKKN